MWWAARSLRYAVGCREPFGPPAVRYKSVLVRSLFIPLDMYEIEYEIQYEKSVVEEILENSPDIRLQGYWCQINRLIESEISLQKHNSPKNYRLVTNQDCPRR